MNKTKTYNDSVHTFGSLWSVGVLLVLLAVPAAFCVRYGVWPSLSAIGKGLLPVAMVCYPTALVEIVAYTPLLGTGGMYLSFATGNISNLKLPCALAAMDTAGVKSNSEEGDVISTIAIATSSLVTTLIIALGVLLLVPLRPILESEALAPAFANIVPALFGALAVVYVSKNAKIAIAPMIFMLALFISVPSLASSVGIFVPVGALIAIGASRILYKKGKL